ncbi:ATP-binding protein [Gracilibacillus xinjiangensis]|uniref:ATP-binding protein n=1 Tax=Gracilibacillus xinjiangensis TaxID=1193282 RepID=A0ABV8WX32_9BACI
MKKFCEINILLYWKFYIDHLKISLSKGKTSECTGKNKFSQQKWNVYRDAISSATQGKFRLISYDQIETYCQGKHLCDMRINSKEDIPLARYAANQAFEKTGIRTPILMNYQLIISEAVTNVIKHANKGKMSIYYKPNEFRIVIQDKGPGFPLEILSQITTQTGFSTKESLGHGFTVMMKMSKQLLLKTSSNGSTLIIILDGLN